jgi:hypothetical protein
MVVHHASLKEGQVFWEAVVQLRPSVSGTVQVCVPDMPPVGVSFARVGPLVPAAAACRWNIVGYPYHSVNICEFPSPPLRKLHAPAVVRLPARHAGCRGAQCRGKLSTVVSDVTTVYSVWFSMLSGVQPCGVRCRRTAAVHLLLPCRSGQPVPPSLLGFNSAQVMRICHAVETRLYFVDATVLSLASLRAAAAARPQNEAAVLLRTCRWQHVNMRARFSMLLCVV